MNGNDEYSLLDDSGRFWLWPEGYAHYIDAHDVMPDEEILLFISTFNIENRKAR
jgi:hypothetical protein